MGSLAVEGGSTGFKGSSATVGDIGGLVKGRSFTVGDRENSIKGW